MIRLTRAELLKVFTTRMVWGMLALALAFTALQAVLSAVFAGQETGPGGPTLPELTEPAGVQSLFGSVSAGLVFTFIIGTLLITQEYRFQTITHTFLGTPRRERVVGAKMAACALVGVFFGLAGLALTFAIGIPAILLSDGDLGLIDGTVARVIGGGVAALALYALLGLAVGSLLRNQIAAVVIGIAWVYVLETLLVFFLPAVGRWLPGGAAAAVYSVPIPGAPEYLEPWAGALLLLGYAVVFAAVAAGTTIRRDIT